MGDQIGTAIGGQLYYVPKEEFDKVLTQDISDIDKVEIFAALCRINILYMIARCGSGHIGSSYSSLEIMAWMHVIHIRDNNDIFFSSKGHDAPALYNVLIGIGKLEFQFIHQLRRLGGLPGHPDISTPNIVTNTGSLGMGISKAKGMIVANRILGRNQKIYVLTGDGELQEGQFWESLISASNNNFHELTVIVDHNKLQSDTLVSKVSDLGDLDLKLTSFGWHVRRCDGNNLSELKNILEEFSTINDKPKVLIADTVKGKGVSFMEHTSIDSDVELYKYHSGAPSEDAYTKASQELFDNLNYKLQSNNLDPIELMIEESSKGTPPINPQKLVEAYSNSILKQAEKNSRIVALDADLVLDTGLIPFAKKFPDRFVECGIAEQDMVSQAGGMALSGLLPIVHSFACFLTARPSEQIYNNSTEHTKIIYVGTLAGILPGGPGHSHQGVRDISSMSAIPGMTVIEPSCENEVESLLNWAIAENEQSSYIRLSSIPVITNFTLPKEYKPELGKGVQVVPGNDALIFAYGPQMLTNAVNAAQKIKETAGINLGVINMPWLNIIDSEWLYDLLQSVDNIFCIDNHYSIGGLNDRISSEINSFKIKLDINLSSISLNKIPVCGTNDEIMKFHKLDTDSIVNKIKSVL